MQVKEWLGEENQLGIDIWEKKYRQNNETLDEWFKRVSGGNTDVEELIRNKKFLFGGRILSNRGIKDTKVTLSNCYVIEPPQDNIESIFDTAKKLARTFSYGGGCGVDISNLAPKGSKVNNTAKETTGSISFMDLYSLTTGLIGQNGRRGALMISLDCNHPDIEEFIDLKTDLTKVTKANISVKLTNDFMNAVKNNQEYDLEFYRPEVNQKIVKKANAKEVFMKLAKNNWSMAEPGCLFWDRIKNWNLLSNVKDFSFAGVNPCFTGDMKLLTEDGYKTFSELDGKNVKLINKDGNISDGKVWCSGTKDIVELKISGGGAIKCTPNHIFMLNNDEECEAKDLKGKRIKSFIQNNVKYDNLFVKLGFIQGDGALGRLASTAHRGIEVNIGEKDGDILSLFSDEKYTNKNYRCIYLSNYVDKLKELKFSQEHLPTRCMPETYNSWAYNQKQSFLRGCFSANGSVIKNYRVSYKTTCRKFAEQLQKTLLDDFGIKSFITTNKPKNVKFSNGEYLCKQSYDINIGKLKDVVKFYSEIGFVHDYKTKDLLHLISIKSPFILSVKPIGKEKVYDFTEPETHWGIVNGVIVHNCAEEALPAGGSCLLGSINLSEFVINPFTDEAEFNYDGFTRAVEITTKGLNEVLDEGIPLHPLQEQRESVSDWRQIGLGIMGLADMLIKLGIKYGSRESVSLCSKISKKMIDNVVKTSALLSKEQGCYPKCKIDEIMSSEFFQTNISAKTKELVSKFGLRNSQLLTIPPCGSTGTMLGVSTGIEPIFANYYTRKTESLNGKDTYYKVYTPIVKKYMEVNNIADDSMLPDFFITSSQINYKDRINMQSTWQKSIDASISSTVNVPNEFTIDDTFNLYCYAWEKGLKGITMFRDNCDRVGILTTGKPQKENAAQEEENITAKYDTITPTHRSEIGKTYGSTVVKKVACGKLFITLNRDENGNLIESFVNTSKNGICGSNIAAVNRLISLALRSGVKVDEIIDQLQSIICPACTKLSSKGEKLGGLSCPDTIAKVLKEEYKNGTFNINNSEIKKEQPKEKEIEKVTETVKPKEVTNWNICPECGEKMNTESGCRTCGNCGFSFCN